MRTSWNSGVGGGERIGRGIAAGRYGLFAACLAIAIGIAAPCAGATGIDAGIQAMVSAACYGSAAPTINSITPTTGSAAGGTVISIWGSHFTISGVTTITFGGVAATNVLHDTTYATYCMSCITPPHAAGVVDVVVTNPDGQSATLSSAYTYTGSVEPSWAEASTAAAWEARYGHTSAVFNDKLWVMGGLTASAYKNDVWYSSDGATWTQATASADWPTRAFHTPLVFDNKLWVIGGFTGSAYLNDAWYSSDGISWTQATASAGWAGRYGHTAAVFDNKMWVMGGYSGSAYNNDVWYSSDGVTWTQATAGAGWAGRGGHMTAVFDSKIWVMGGLTASGFKSDVWYSSDGATWVEATAGAAWTARVAQTMAVCDGKMWILGGGTGTTNSNDVWSSADGVTWTQSAMTPGWTARYGHSTPVFNGQLWVLGGNAGTLANDVWHWADQGPGGTLKVSLTPSAAVTAGARWNVNGGEWRSSGVSLEGLTPGVQTVAFKSVSGWTAPADQTPTIVAGYTTNATGTYTPGPVIGSISPTSGPVAGGTAIEIWGAYFTASGVTTITFGGVEATNVTHDSVYASTHMYCVTPAHAAGAVNIVITNPDGKTATLSSGFTYVAASAPVIGTISPTSGDIAGGTTVHIWGSHFTATGVTTVTFGGVAATNVTHDSAYASSHMYCVTPAHAAGAVDVVVTNPDAQSATLSNGFTYTGSASEGEGEGESTYTLTVMNDPAAGGTVTPSSAGPYVSGTVVTLTAEPASGFAFSHWSGDVSNTTANPTTITMTGNKTVTAYFTAASEGEGEGEGEPYWMEACGGASWSERYGHTTAVFNNKLWVMGGQTSSGDFKNDVWYSSDGVTWKQATANAGWAARYYHTTAVFNDKLWVMGGRTGSGSKNDVWYSSDGATWTQATASAGWEARVCHTTAVFNDKLWVIGGVQSSGGYKNDVWYSSDGVTWTQATASAGWTARYGHTTAVFDNKLWVMGGYTGSDYKNDVWYSSDGVTWTQATASAGWAAREGHTTAVFDNKLWVMGGYTGSDYKNDVWYSSDGVSWKRATAGATWAAREDHTTVVYNDKLWVIGGVHSLGDFRNDVWCSSDGATWTEATTSAAWAARESHTTAVFNDKLWVIGGVARSGAFKNDVWYSSDGVTWTQATASAAWEARHGHTTAVFNDKLWVIGGYTSFSAYKNDVWYSSDGVTWTQATASAAWAARYDYTTAVFNDKLWVMGGYGSGAYKNDVWYSSDGVSWTQATASAAWTARAGHTTAVFNDKLWVLGGDIGSYKNDVWWSSDGITWTQSTVTSEWQARSGHTTAVFDDKLWVLGGYSSGYRNDVLYWTGQEPLGTLAVVLSPDSVVVDGAQWRMDSGDWQASGVSLTNLTPGAHTVSFKPVANWTTPSDQAVTLVAGQLTSVTGTYTAVAGTGSIQAAITPVDAVTAGAQWRVDSGPWRSSGATAMALAAGSHVVSFKPLTGWVTPDDQTVTVASGVTTPATAAYVVETHTLSVTAGSGGAAAPNPVMTDYPYGTQVTLTATPNTGYRFVSWNINGTTYSNAQMTIAITSDTTAAATFVRVYTLTVTNAPASLGSVTLNPAGGVYATGTVVTLTPVPVLWNRFTGWGGVLSGTTVPATVTMDADKPVTANFAACSTQSITGVVTNWRTSEVLAGVTVTALEESTSRTIDTVQTGTDGTYTISVPGEIPLKLAYVLADYKTAQRRSIYASAALNVGLEAAHPAPATQVTAAAGAVYIHVGWTPSTSPNVVGYKVYRSESSTWSSGTSTLVSGASAIDAVSFNDTEPGTTTHYYWVIAVADDASVSNASGSNPVAAKGVTVHLADVTGDKGTQIRVPVSVEIADGIGAAGMDFNLVYPAALIDAAQTVAIEKTAITQAMSIRSNVAESGRVRIEGVTGQQKTLAGAGKLFDVVFTLRSDLEGQQCGSLALPDFSDSGTARPGVTMYDASSNAIIVNYGETGQLCGAGSLVVEGCRQGDLTGDRVADYTDAAVALKSAVGSTSITDECRLKAGDLNGDLKIDTADAVMIMRLKDGLSLNPPEGATTLYTLSSAKQGPALVTVGTASGEPGRWVDVPVTVDDVDAVSGLELGISYPDGLQFASASVGTLTPDFRIQSSAQSGYVRVALGRAAALGSGGGQVAVLRFLVTPGAAPGSTLALVLNAASLKGAYGDSLEWYNTLSRQSGSVTVLEPVTPQYTLSVKIEGQGTTSPDSTSPHTYDAKTVVNLSAWPAQDWVFDHWQIGSGTVTSSTSSVTMDSDKVVTAVFTPVFATYVEPSGSGQIVLEPATGPYETGSGLHIEGVANAGYRFDHWKDDFAGTANPTIVSMSDSVRRITGVFVKTYALSMAVTGGGTVTPAAGEHVYDTGTVVAITASAPAGWRFDHWTGPVANASQASTTVAMGADRTVGAVFIQTFVLTTGVTGNGVVDPAAGAHTYDVGSAVSVTATADVWNRFVEWRDGLSGTANPGTISMMADHVVTAAFETCPVETLSGVVTNWRTGAPLAGVAVSIAEDTNAGRSVTQTTTGADGSYSASVPGLTLLKASFALDGFKAMVRHGITAPATVSVGMDPFQPLPPTNVRAAATAGYVLATWTASASPEVVGYSVYRSVSDTWNAAESTLLTPEPIAALSYGDTSAGTGTYYYWVVAVAGAQAKSEPARSPAAVSNIVKLSLADVSGASGSRVRVSISVATVLETGVSSLSIDLLYPESLVDVSQGITVEKTLITEQMDITTDTSQAGHVIISTTGTSGAIALTGQGRLFDVVLTLAANAATCGTLSFHAVTVNDANGQAVAMDYTDTGELCGTTNPAVTGCRQGDLSGDWLVTSADVIKALKAAVGIEDVTDDCRFHAADLNGDNEIDSADAILIGRLSVGIPLNPGTGKSRLPELSKTAPLTITVGQSQGEAGRWVSVPVSLDDATGVSGIELGISYPPDLQLDSASVGALTADFTSEFNAEAGYVRVAMSRETALDSGSGTIAVLRFLVAPGAEVGSVLPLPLTSVKLKGEYGDSFDWYTSFNQVSGGITVREASTSGYTLLVSVEGQGTTTPEAGVEQAAEPGQTFTLQAVPASGWSFEHWVIDGIRETAASPVVTMDSDKVVTAVFVPVFTAESSPAAGGAVALDPASGPYELGMGVRLTATPAAGYRFDHWEGAATGTLNPVLASVDPEAGAATAVFIKTYALSVAASPTQAGTVAANPAAERYDEGTQVSLTATANAGWRFDHWSGSVTDTAASTTLTMDADKTATAVFVRTYTLALSVTGQGTVAPDAGTVHTYDTGASVVLTATPAAGWRFDRWTGAVTGTAASTTLTMDADKAVTAVFVRTYTLALSVTGQGTVTPDAGTVHTYDTDAVVTLKATPATGWRFDHWTGSVANASQASTSITMTSDMTVGAVFIRTFVLNMAAAGNGTVEPASGTYTYDAGSIVTVKAVPSQGFILDYWEGGLTGDSLSVDITMDADKTVTAVFISGTSSLTLEAEPAEGGSVTVVPDNGPYATKTLVALTAVPASGYLFSHWSGDVSGNAASTTLRMHGDKSVTAVFVSMRYAVSTSVSPVNAGTVALEPPDGTYAPGTAVTALATPAEGYAFSRWEGSVPDTSNPVSFEVNGDCHLTAVYVPLYTLAVTASPEGGGTCTVSPEGGPYTTGTAVTLTAHPAAGYTFTRWTADDGTTATANPFVLTITGNRMVSAQFITGGEGEGEGEGAISGVADNSVTGAPVSGVTVELSTAAKAVRRATTDETGRYTFAGLPIGSAYDISFTMPEYKTAMLNQVVVPDTSAGVHLVPLDVMTPSQPLVHAGTMKMYIEWNANTEYNLKGYAVYRTEVDAQGTAIGAPVKVNGEPADVYDGLVAANAFIDPVYGDEAPNGFETGKWYVYQVRAVSGAELVSELSGASTPPARGGHVALFMPAQTGVYDAGIYQQWADDGALVTTVPIAASSVYEVSSAGMAIAVRLPKAVVNETAMEASNVAPSAITSQMAFTSGVEEIPGDDDHVLLRIESSVDENDATSLYGAGTLFYALLRSDPFDVCATMDIAGSVPGTTAVTVLYGTETTGTALDVSAGDAQLCPTADCMAGDVNGDRRVDGTDVESINAACVGLVELDDCATTAGDVNLDGCIDSADATLVTRWIAGLPIAAPIAAAKTQSDSSVTVSAGNVTGHPGDLVAVPVTFAGTENLAAFELSIAFPAGTQGLTFESVTLDPALTARGFRMASAHGETAGRGYIRICASNGEALGSADSTILLTLGFRIVGTDLAGLPVRIMSFQWSDTYGTTPKFGMAGTAAASNGAVAVSETSGQLVVTIDPDVLRDAGAQWSADNGATWHTSGETVSVSAGAHVVTFAGVAGQVSPGCFAPAVTWNKPNDMEVTITAGQVLRVEGEYTEGDKTFSAASAGTIPGGILILSLVAATLCTARSRRRT